MAKQSEIKKTLKKWLNFNEKTTIFYDKANIAMMCLATPCVVIDIMLTGGSFILALASVHGTAGTLSTFNLIKKHKKSKRLNTAGQEILATPLIHTALNEMEKSLTTAFKLVTDYPDNPNTKKLFVNKAEEVLSDFQTLSSKLSITSSGKYDLGKTHYRFILDKSTLGDNKDEIMTLKKAITDMKDKKEKLKKPNRPNSGRIFII